MHECPHGLPNFGLTACYAELKEQVRRGERLTAEELEFVGYTEPRRHRNGWHPIGAYLPASVEDDREELSAEDSAMLHALMDMPRAGQLEFLA